jgi:hypothetical protein
MNEEGVEGSGGNIIWGTAGTEGNQDSRESLLNTKRLLNPVEGRERSEQKKTKFHGLSSRTSYQPSDRHLSAKLMPTFADRGCHVVSVTEPYVHILGFLDRSRYFFFQVAPHLYSRGWVDPVPDPLLLRKSGSIGNRTRTSGSVARNSGH